MSARTARVFLDLCRKHGFLGAAKEIRYFCLSRQVGQELETLQPLDVRVASTPELSALLMLIGGKDKRPGPDHPVNGNAPIALYDADDQ
jgi:hypothetical protein